MDGLLLVLFVLLLLSFLPMPGPCRFLRVTHRIFLVWYTEMAHWILYLCNTSDDSIEIDSDQMALRT